MTHLVPDAPKAGTSPKKAARRKRKDEEMLEQARVQAVVDGLTPHAVVITESDGSILEPVTTRAGRVLKV